MMTTATPTAVVPLELSELAKPLPAALAAFRGRVVDLRPFSAHTQLAQFTLASIGTPTDQQARAVVEIKGAWAENACKRITKGDVLVLTTKGVTLLNAHDDTEAKRPARLRFNDGMTGWIQHRDGTEDLISYPRESHAFPLQGDASQADLISLLTLRYSIIKETKRTSRGAEESGKQTGCASRCCRVDWCWRRRRHRCTGLQHEGRTRVCVN